MRTSGWYDWQDSPRSCRCSDVRIICSWRIHNLTCFSSRLPMCCSRALSKRRTHNHAYPVWSEVLRDAFWFWLDWCRVIAINQVRVRKYFGERYLSSFEKSCKHQDKDGKETGGKNKDGTQRNGRKESVTLRFYDELQTRIPPVENILQRNAYITREARQDTRDLRRTRPGSASESRYRAQRKMQRPEG